MPRSTFINDRLAETYPFAPTKDALLPFSSSCIRELRICVKKAADGLSLPVFYVSGVEISEDGTVTVSLSAGQDIQLCKLTAEPQGASDVVSVGFYYGGYAYIASCLMFAGIPHPTDAGTYAVYLPLALGCVTTMSNDAYSRIDSLTISGEKQTLSDTLYINTRGYFKTAFETLNEDYDGYPQLIVTLTADIPSGAVLSTQPTRTETYKHVTAINGHVMAPSSCIVIQPESYARDDADKDKVLLTFETRNMVAGKSGGSRLSEEAEVDAYKKHDGDVCIINLHGTSAFPHCYGSIDMAGTSTEFHERHQPASSSNHGSGQQGMIEKL